jgi:glycosyltransferase involved in cell wall biosynthesis
MRILQVTPTYKPAYIYGGVTVSISLLCESLAAEGHDILVVTTTANGKTEFPKHTEKPVLVEGAPTLYFPRWTGDPLQFSPPLFLWLWRNVRFYEVVHVHSWWNLVAMCSVFICLLRGVKPVLSPRGMISNYTIQGFVKRVFHRFLGQFLLKNTFLHATAAQEQREGLRINSRWQSAVLPNLLQLKNVPTRPIKPANRRFEILFFSRIHPKKGLELLFEALKNLPFDWHLTLAGDGEAGYPEALKASIEKEDFSKKITWLGWVNGANKYTVLGQADLMVLPSYNENFANVVIESLAIGTPVLLSQQTGLSDYVAEKDLGWVCETTVKSVQTTLKQAFEDTTKRQRIEYQSPDIVRHDFAPSVLAHQYVEMYHNFMEIEKKRFEMTPQYFL